MAVSQSSPSSAFAGSPPSRSPTRAAQHLWKPYLVLGTARAATTTTTRYCNYAPSFSVQPVQRSPGDS